MKCLYLNCKRNAVVRGLCRSHYGYAGVLIRNGKTTWKRLEKAGKSLPIPENRGRKSTSWFLK